MANSQMSTEMPGNRLDSATLRLSALLAKLEHDQEEVRGVEFAEECDVMVCRAVRSAFTYFVDFCAWQVPEERSVAKTNADTLLALFERAIALLNRSTYPSAPLYQKSVAEKRALMCGLRGGKTLAEMLPETGSQS
ncbi:MAG TPA: hypothetical protein VFG04_08550 [Planctomycetaceae bacterium]|jgi:hypothetical protein|nr:hypothetical protein [Planctomycetaceae bacterium]